MFGPNCSTSSNFKIYYHHRESAFFELYKNCQNIFREKFNISDDYEILFQTGSGTLSIETIINSYNGKFNLDGIKGDFYNRWKKMLKYYNKFDASGKKMYVQYETSLSYNNKNCEEPFFVDSVSSFPYYNLPKNFSIAVTVSSKCLGAIPVLGIIIIKKNILNQFINEDISSYLNLNRLIMFSKVSQTPSTPSIVNIYDLYLKLLKFDRNELIKKINNVSDMLVDAFGKKNIIGDLRGPAITLNKEFVFNKKILEKYSPYGTFTNSKYSSYQIFTYSEKTSLYQDLVNDFKKLK